MRYYMVGIRDHLGETGISILFLARGKQNIMSAKGKAFLWTTGGPRADT